MATIKLEGNASGSGSVSLTAPNTNSTRTITLPDEDGVLGVLNTTYGAVGTYAMLWANVNAQRSPGATIAGSSLYPANTITSTSLSGDYTGAGTPSGTWRLMGATGYYNSTIALSRRDLMVSVWVRIS